MPSGVFDPVAEHLRRTLTCHKPESAGYSDCIDGITRRQTDGWGPTRAHTTFMAVLRSWC